MLGVLFLFSQFLPVEITVFSKNFLYPIEDIDLLSSNLKRYFTSDYFLLSSEDLKIANLVIFWTKLCAF